MPYSKLSGGGGGGGGGFEIHCVRRYFIHVVFFIKDLQPSKPAISLSANLDQSLSVENYSFLGWIDSNLKSITI